MGPTCSIFFEREPVEEYIMKLPPRKKDGWLFKREEIIISIVQGFVIAAGTLSVYYWYMSNGNSLQEVRTVVFSTLVFSNIFLTFANRSFHDTIVKTIHYKNNLTAAVLLTSIFFLVLIHWVPYIRGLFGMAAISVQTFLVCIATALLSVGWFELYKTRLKSVESPHQTDYNHALE